MEVKVYTTSTCPYCTMVKEFLSQNDVSFEERRVDDDPDAYKEFIRLDVGMGVPVTVIDGEPVVGFDREKIRALLEKK